MVQRPVIHLRGPPTSLMVGLIERLLRTSSDLIIDGLRAYSTLEMTTENSNDACMIAEGCIQGYGVREIVRFDTEIA
ncbi:MAG: hypothetical protein QF699_03740, partial [Candidatus Poseidoniaceae archaeon]|nr:hypothetical protein [Candidatus Poseidoniaceae archaeon]